jgi:NitT/TauT family transport system ATP-binding protein
VVTNVPTVYPKCSPTELLGLLVLLKSHKSSEDIALLADDLDLEIDEIIPSTEFAEALGLIKISEGRATMTDVGTRLLAATIRERKALLREQLKKTTLFRTLVQALESKPDKRLTEEELNDLVEFTTAPTDEFVQNIINWGRFTELFRYDADQRALLPPRPRPAPRSPGSGGHPPSGHGGSSEEKGPRSAAPAPDTPPASASTRALPIGTRA